MSTENPSTAQRRKRKTSMPEVWERLPQDVREGKSLPTEKLPETFWVCENPPSRAIVRGFDPASPPQPSSKKTMEMRTKEFRRKITAWKKLSALGFRPVSEEEYKRFLPEIEKPEARKDLVAHTAEGWALYYEQAVARRLSLYYPKLVVRRAGHNTACHDCSERIFYGDPCAARPEGYEEVYCLSCVIPEDMAPQNA